MPRIAFPTSATTASNIIPRVSSIYNTYDVALTNATIDMASSSSKGQVRLYTEKWQYSSKVIN